MTWQTARPWLFVMFIISIAVGLIKQSLTPDEPSSAHPDIGHDLPSLSDADGAIVAAAIRAEGWHCPRLAVSVPGARTGIWQVHCGPAGSLGQAYLEGFFVRIDNDGRIRAITPN